MGYNMDDAFPSKGISASDLQGKTVLVVIEKVEFKQYQSGDDGFVMYFKNKKKPLSINKTKNGILKAAFGSNSDGWVGQTINISPGRTLYMGNEVDCVNVSIPQPAGSGPAPDAAAAAAAAAIAAAAQQPSVPEDEIPF